MSSTQQAFSDSKNNWPVCGGGLKRRNGYLKTSAKSAKASTSVTLRKFIESQQAELTAGKNGRKAVRDEHLFDAYLRRLHPLKNCSLTSLISFLPVLEGSTCDRDSSSDNTSNWKFCCSLPSRCSSSDPTESLSVVISLHPEDDEHRCCSLQLFRALASSMSKCVNDGTTSLQEVLSIVNAGTSLEAEAYHPPPDCNNLSRVIRHPRTCFQSYGCIQNFNNLQKYFCTPLLDPLENPSWMLHTYQATKISGLAIFLEAFTKNLQLSRELQSILNAPSANPASL